MLASSTLCESPQHVLSFLCCSLNAIFYSANDQEDDRQGLNSILSERALREIYLKPFMLAQKNAQPWAFMTSWVAFHAIQYSKPC